jgi:flavin reductase (DIM6/NTAB) family NADH-FMN oxidoreductase RutF
MILTAATSQTPKPFYKGLTLSSVTSLSIDPDPLVQFNLMKPSLTATYLHAYEKFALHILSPSEYSCDLARLFARNRHYDESLKDYVPFEPFKHLQEHEYEFYDNVHGCSLPILTKVEKVMICSKVQTLSVQDHEVWVAKVDEVIDKNNGVKTGGLLNFNRKFHIVGEDLHKSTKVD